VILTVCADKGSPGVSTVATALGVVWPGERVLLEADPSGGDAALRMRTPQGELLARQPNVRALSVDARSGPLPSSLLSYAQQTSLGLPVIAATDMRTEDLALISKQWPAVAAAASQWQGTVIADLGRLQEDSASGAVAAASTVVVLVARATPEGLYHLRERASALTARLGQGQHGRSPLTVALICGPKEHTARLGDLRAHLDADATTSAIPIAGWIAQDPRGVQALRDGQLDKQLMRSDLIRSVTALTETLLSWWPQSGTEAAPQVPVAAPALVGSPSMTGAGWSA
jgi:hypothetical protein